MKVGRNDPCPCGSGRKYKKCCGAAAGKVIEATEAFKLGDKAEIGNFSFSDDEEIEPTFRESIGAPNLATEQIHRLRQELRSREFATIEDLQRFVEESNRRINDAPDDGFFGLSPAEMHLVLHDQKTAMDRLVTGYGPLDATEAERVPFLAQTLFLLRALAEGPLALTATDALKPAFVARWYEASFERYADPRYRAFEKPRRECDFPAMSRIRNACAKAGLTRHKGKELVISSRARAMLDSEDLSPLYGESVRGYAFCAADDGFEGNARIPWLAGHAVIFGLYLVRALAPAPITQASVEDAFARAFPHDPNRDHPDYLPVVACHACIFPAMNLGLLEPRHWIDVVMDGEGMDFKRTAFAESLIKWKE